MGVGAVTVGMEVGASVGPFVGAAVGPFEGALVGALVGVAVGIFVGTQVSPGSVGDLLGALVGAVGAAQHNDGRLRCSQRIRQSDTRTARRTAGGRAAEPIARAQSRGAATVL